MISLALATVLSIDNACMSFHSLAVKSSENVVSYLSFESFTDILHTIYVELNLQLFNAYLHLFKKIKNVASWISYVLFFSFLLENFKSHASVHSLSYFGRED